MAFAPSQPGIVSEREFSIIADGLFNGELDERAARLAEREREFDLLADEVERLRLFNEELDLRAERMDRRGRDLAHAIEMRAAELDIREQQLWDEQEALRGEVERSRALLLSERREYNEYVEDTGKAHREAERRLWDDYELRCAALNQREAAVTARELLQRGREAELGHWQSQLEAREDELATREVDQETREVYAHQFRRRGTAPEVEAVEDPADT